MKAAPMSESSLVAIARAELTSSSRGSLLELRNAMPIISFPLLRIKDADAGVSNASIQAAEGPEKQIPPNGKLRRNHRGLAITLHQMNVPEGDRSFACSPRATSIRSPTKSAKR